ncbi:MAG TPA: DUF5666 domain-containing protein [Anaerolineae bacterium]
MNTQKFAAVAAILMMTVASGCSAGPTAAQAPAQAAAQTTGAQAANQNGSGRFNSANFATGRVKAVNGNTIQVSTATEVLTVKATAQTKVQKTTGGGASDIQTGITMTVRGTRATDGSLTAQMIQIGDVMGGMRPGAGGPPPAGQSSGGQGQAGQNAAGQGAPGAGAPPAPPDGGAAAVGGQGNGAGRGQGAGAPNGGSGGRQFNPDSFATGQVKQVDGKTIQLTTTGGSVVSVTLNDQTLIQKTMAASVSDIAVGERITTQGTRGSNNTFTAQSIQVGDTRAPGQPGPGQPAPATPAASG